MPTIRPAGFAALALTLGLLATVRADDRAPVPAAADVAKAEATVKELFKADYAKTKAAARAALAAKFLKDAGDTKEEPAARFVLLREARDLAAKAGDPALALQAADELVAQFKVPAGETRVKVIGPLIAAASTPTATKATAEALVAAADATWAADDWPAVIELLNGAATAARKGRYVALESSINAKIKQAEVIKVEAEKVKISAAALRADPADPAANLAVGRFTALVLHNWEAGVELLAKGSDPALKAAAEKDRKAAGGEDADVLAAGDAWYDYAQNADAVTKPGAQLRAHQWYSQALPNLSGLSKAKVEKRLTELQPAATAAGGSKGKMWDAVRTGVTSGKLKRWEIVGGAFSKTPYEEVPKEGAVLIGFNYTTQKGGQYPGVVQPIWLTPRGEVKGKIYGIAERGSVMLTTRAKPGYAVGAIYTRGGGGFDAFKPVYMRIKDAGLDPADQYDGPYVGGKGGGEGTLGGDGNFIVGLHGKLENNTRMACISPVTLSGTAPTTTPKKVNPKKKP
jgi:hypothetical protein